MKKLLNFIGKSIGIINKGNTHLKALKNLSESENSPKFSPENSRTFLKYYWSTAGPGIKDLVDEFDNDKVEHIIYDIVKAIDTILEE